MLKYTGTYIVFQEVSDEVSLAFNLSLCPNHCPGCHSPELWEDIGEELTEEAIDKAMEQYGTSITCVAIMGGDNDPSRVATLAEYIHSKGKKVCWYSGKEDLAAMAHYFDYIKVGPYIAACGGLDNPKTNQRLYKVDGDNLVDITYRMQKQA